METITLIINAAPSDIGYAELNILHLTRQHKNILNKVLIVDTSLNRDRNLRDEYKIKYDKIIELGNELLEKKIISRLILTHQYKYPSNLYKKYFGNLIHKDDEYDYRGAPIKPYLIGFEETKTQFQLRYDVDMLLYQPVDEDWTDLAIKRLMADEKLLCASPRTSPSQSIPKEHYDDIVCWFSTRCSLMNMEVFWFAQRKYRLIFRLKILLRKLSGKGYPPAFEYVIYQIMIFNKLNSIYLNSYSSYLLHPEDKSFQYISLLSSIIKCVEKNFIPRNQINDECVNLKEWSKYLSDKC